MDFKFEYPVLIFHLNGHRLSSRNIDTDDKSNRMELKIECHIYPGDGDGPIFKVVDGVTGFEGYSLERLFRNDIPGDFVVCAGTQNSWDRLVIYEKEWNDCKAIYSSREWWPHMKGV